MDDQLDNDLKNRIREVFDNYEDASADEGWLLLREKFPGKAKRRPAVWLWWGSAAAVLLLFVGVLWFNSTPVKQKLALNKKQHPDTLLPKSAQPQKENIVNTTVKTDSATLHQQSQQLANNTARTSPAANKPRQSNQQQAQLLAANEQHTATHTNVREKNAVPQKSNASAQVKTPDQNIAAAKITGNTKADTGTNQPLKSLAAVVKPPGVNMMEQTRKSKIDGNNKADTASSTSAKSMAATTPGVDMRKQVKEANRTLFADDNTPDKKKTKKESTDKTVRFGVYAATYFNYSKGSNSQLNVGAGVTSDIKLSNNIKLSTGVAIAQNTMSYSSQPPVTGALDAPASMYTFSAVPQSIYNTVTPTLRNYNASLVGLDVPINFKYEFAPQKSSAYVSLGLSSGTFINETYNYAYNYPALFASNGAQTQDQSTHQSFGSFYFAKTLNFSFGTGYSIGGNKLIIEPFLKYPLDGLGSQQLKFGAGGLNLKFSFDK